jgi:exoribonuclease II
VQGLGTAKVTVGIHIAAPGLGIAPGSPADEVASQRLSTVYVPGFKLTMLPWSVVSAFTLAQGQSVPAASLYLTLDATTLEVIQHETKLERVPIAANLRHDQLDGVVTEEALSALSADATQAAPFDFAHELAFLHRLAKHLKAAREVVRGKPENFNRPDPVFKLRTDDQASLEAQGPTGDELIDIGFRQRGAALDLIVAEAMILANSTWGKWMATLNVPAIYRSQASMAPGIKVRMGTKPMPHAGIGVSHYAWSTSPLRRYVDLVNQWQLIACVRHGATAALAAPFKPRDASLLAVVSAFDAAYADYATVQRILERYWMMRWVKQQGLSEVEGTVMMGGAVRVDAVPLVMQVAGVDNLPRGSRVKVQITQLDELSLEAHARLVARLDGVSPQSDGAQDSDDAQNDTGVSPLALAIEVDGPADPGADLPNADNGSRPDGQASAPNPA